MALMERAAAQKRLAELRAVVAHHAELYYRQAHPEISDRDYDRLLRELADLEAQFPEFASKDSPAARVGDDRLEGFTTYRHRQAMQSLDNTYSEAELRQFHTRLVKLFGREELAYVVEPKIDGLAVSLTYEKGRFVRAVTRGNGVEGDDITAELVLQCLRSVQCDYLSMVYECHAPAEVVSFLNVMRCQYQGCLMHFIKFLNIIPDMPSRLWVKADCRLVKE